MVFNVAMLNCDDHTKNFAFVQNKKDFKWRVSPAYDMAFAYDPNNAWVKNHMSIQGKHSNITYHDLLKEGQKHHIRAAKRIIYEVLEGASRFQQEAKANDMVPEMTSYIQKRLNGIYQSLGAPKK